MILLWNSAAMIVELTLVNDAKRYETTWQADRNLAHGMLAYLRDQLATHNATFADIEGIGVFRGPGSYTGLRIGLAVLNAIAASEHIPIVGATEATWQSACLVRLANGEDDRIVLPDYGGAAHTTKPRK